MTKDNAIARAKKLARAAQADMFIYYEGDGDYQVGNEFDSQTFFNGSNPYAIIDCTGEMHECNGVY